MVKQFSKNIVTTVKKHPQIAVGFAIFSALGAAMLIYYMVRKNKFVRYAKKWTGEREISGNMGFENEEFDRLMREYGDFRNTAAWCASFVKMVVMKKVGRRHEELVDRLITPGTQQTFDNFAKDDSGLFEITKDAKKGDLVIWQKYQNGVPTYQGHIGIVEKVNKDSFTTIEGNTNDSGGREGIEVGQMERKYNWTVTDGLRLKGFIHIKRAI